MRIKALAYVRANRATKIPILVELSELTPMALCQSAAALRDALELISVRARSPPTSGS